MGGRAHAVEAVSPPARFAANPANCRAVSVPFAAHSTCREGGFLGGGAAKGLQTLHRRLRDLWGRFVLVFTAFSFKKKRRTGENPVRLRGRGTFCRAGCVLPTPEKGRLCRGEADALARYFSCVRGFLFESAANWWAWTVGECRRWRQPFGAALLPPSRFLFSTSILQGRKKFLKSDQSSHGLASPSCRAGQSSLTSPKSSLY